MALEIPIPVTFTIKMTTERAYIVNDVMLKNNLYINEAVLPKMYTEIQKSRKKVKTAFVEKWVLQQRYTEENTVDVEEHVEELLSVV
jgi:hypothetical protein